MYCPYYTRIRLVHPFVSYRYINLYSGTNRRIWAGVHSSVRRYRIRGARGPPSHSRPCRSTARGTSRTLTHWAARTSRTGSQPGSRTRYLRDTEKFKKVEEVREIKKEYTYILNLFGKSYWKIMFYIKINRHMSPLQARNPKAVRPIQQIIAVFMFSLRQKERSFWQK